MPWVLACLLAACGGEPTRAASSLSSSSSTSGRAASAGGEPPPSAPTPTPDPPDARAATEPLAVTGRAPDPAAGFDVSARSDLPPPVASTAQPYARVIASHVAPLRPALRACLAPLGPTAPRLYRVTAEPDGFLRPRAPQPVALPPRVAACAEALVHGTALDPPPARAVPYDIYLDPAPTPARQPGSGFVPR